MTHARQLLKPVLSVILMVLLVTGSALAAELDDSELFVEAFNAYQKKDYLLTIAKVRQVNQLFPDTPLRDVSLLLLARAGLRSGDNELAAKTVNQFYAEFSDSSLKASLEDELVTLGARQKKGERLPHNKQLQLSAQKVRSEQVALERAAAMKAEQIRLAKENEERERIAAEKAEAKRKERERIAAEKAARESIKLAIVLPVDSTPIDAGKNGQIPIELINKGTGREEFILSASAPSEYSLMLTTTEKPNTPVERVLLAAGEKFNGYAAFRMPASRVDGYKAVLQVKAVSAKFDDINFSNDTRIIASAPLVRAVSKPGKAKVVRGEATKYRVTVLNAGSLAANGLTMRVILPAQLEFIDAAGTDYRQESAGIITFKVDTLETGRLAEFSLNVKVRENAEDKQELRCQVEVINSQLQTKDTYNSSAAVVQGK